MSTLGKAFEIASRALVDRVYGDGDPYVMHCVAVMSQVRGVPERTVAMLHAAVEESRVTLEELGAEGFSTEVIEALGLLTRRQGETAVECARRVAGHRLARAVKFVDAAVHMNEDCVRDGGMSPEAALEYSEVKAVLIAAGRDAT